MSVAAHRQKVGNIIWACWQPGGAGVRIGDVRRVNSGAMLIMVTQEGAEHINTEIQKGPEMGGMRPWHFDLALKQFLAPAENNERVKACYIFPPVGNYTTHVSGCDTRNFGAGTSGRPNCWQEEWSCPGTTLDEDPQRRPKRFLRWNGDKHYFDVGSADVGFDTGGTLEWRSFWIGDSAHPALRDEEQRRPQRSIQKRPAGKGPAGIEPAAIPDGAAQDTDHDRKKGGQLTTQDVLRKKGGPKGKGKEPPFSLWPDRPGSRQPSLDDDPISRWRDDDDAGTAKVVKTSKRQKRNL